jgi:hypothetical protein
MRKPVTHIIHKLNLEIEVPGERLARYMYDQAGKLLQEHVLPMLETILKEYKEEEHIRLDTLNLNLDAATAGTLEDTIRQQLAIAIGKQLKHTVDTRQQAADIGSDRGETAAAENIPEGFEQEIPGIKISTGPQQLTEAFLFFLETGAAPWWLSDTRSLAQSSEMVHAIAQQEEQFVVLFLNKIRERASVLERLVQQYDSVLLTYLFSLVAPLPLLTAALRLEQRLAPGQAEIQVQLTEKKRRQYYWAMVWRLFPVEQLGTLQTETFIRKLERAMQVYFKAYSNAATHRQDPMYWPAPEEVEAYAGSSDVTGQEMPETTSAQNTGQRTVEQKEAEPLANEENGILVSHAGLILLHPYLQHFFQALALTEGSQFKDKRSVAIAVHLLHYLATGEEKAAEFDLVFEKYLCGIDTTEIIYRFTEVDEHMKEEAAALLTAVIRNWPVLKNTSPDGLRGNFLQRSGKLQCSNDHHKLVMERQVHDILLNQLPWNISLVKLPWHNHLVHVEWL